MKREQLMVAALENGTVIDHIPAHRLFEVVRLLRIDEEDDNAVFIGYNLQSKILPKKGIVKVANRFYTEAQLNQLAVLSPNVTHSVIRDYEVVEKKTVELPQELHNIVQCNNPKCICNNEPMPTRFTAREKMLTCHYCEKEQSLEAVKLV